ncbi:MAG: hypothetical protein OXM02_00085 [Bacteroidota bacterium]|nr:hypothetical protein [Bacteroidota bacterium]MDE2832902.1 hypothetical protein [Bacteroidota bacterium]MDE2956123.1 hypothetical protein [Bacteroidota bacterium]
MGTVAEVFDLSTRKDGRAPRMLLIHERVPNGPILKAPDPGDLEILHFTGRVRDIFGLGYRGIQTNAALVSGFRLASRQFNMFLRIQCTQGFQAARLPRMPTRIYKSERLTHPPSGRITAQVVLLLEQRDQPRQLGPRRYQYLWLSVHVG